MFEFDFDDLGEVEGDIKGRTAGALRGRGAFSSKIEAEAPRAPAKSKATAKPKAKAKVQEDLLGALAAEEDARAAEMLARLAPPMHGYTPSPAAPAAPTAPAAPALAPVQPVAQAAPEVLKQSAQRTSKPEKSVPRPREDIERVEENPRPFEDEDKAYRAAAEAAAERALERDRNSDWWKKLQAQTKPSPVARCERLPIHRDPTGKRKTCPLPTRGFKVLVEAHPVRSQPCAGALVCGGRKQNEIIRAVEETFDGWVKLAEEDGWMCQGAEEGNSGKKCLEALEKPRAVAVETLAKTPGRQMVEVVADDGVDVLQEPVEGALVLGRRSFGEFLLSDSQTYHGWIRLSDDEGWAQAVSGSGERMLMGIRPDELQLTTTDGEAAPEEAQKEQTAAAMVEAARREALRQLESAALSGNSAFFCAALEVARQQGVSKKDIAKANAMRS